MEEVVIWIKAHLDLILPLIISLGIAWRDLKTRRIPNYLTFGCALAGLGFRLGWQGYPGLLDGVYGLALGFGLMFIPYLLGGMGAGDVKAVAALGTWLGLLHTFQLFVYMAICGGAISLVALCWRGQLTAGLRRFWAFLKNWHLTAPAGGLPAVPGGAKAFGIPYGAAIALGMVYLVLAHH